MEDFSVEIMKKALRFESMLDDVLRRRGVARQKAREDLLLSFCTTLDGEHRYRENLKHDALQEMWKSRLCARMDALDRTIQKQSKQINMLRFWVRDRATKEEYEELKEGMLTVEATEPPCDMCLEVMDSFTDLELANLPPVPELIRQNATTGQN